MSRKELQYICVYIFSIFGMLNIAQHYGTISGQIEETVTYG